MNRPFKAGTDSDSTDLTAGGHHESRNATKETPKLATNIEEDKQVKTEEENIKHEAPDEDTANQVSGMLASLLMILL